MRTSTFENIGTNYAGQRIVNGLPEEMCFTVEKKPMGYLNDRGTFQVIKGTSTVVDSNGRAYGPVSDNYCALDNPTALGALQYIEGMQLKKFGATASGMQYVIGALEQVEILGDAFTPYLIFRNSFNGRYPVQAAICPLRIVCQNQFNIAFKEAENQMNIRHTVKATEKLEEAQKILLGTADYLKTLTKQAEKYASTKVTAIQAETIIREMFPIKDSMTDRQKQTITNKIVSFRNAINADDNRNFKGTAWGLINAYADFATHEEPVRQTKTQAENQFIAVTFDPRIMQKMLSMLTSVVA